MKAIVIVTLVSGLAFGLLFGAPILSADGLRWDGSSNVARINANRVLEAQRIASAERLEMERLALRDAESERAGEFWRTFWLVVGAVVVVVVVARYGYLGGCRLLAYWQHREDRRAEIMLAALPILARRPGSRVELIEAEWYVVDDAARQKIPVARRLLGK